MSGVRLWILVLVLAGSVLNFLGHTRRSDVLCLDLNPLRFGWCHLQHRIPAGANPSTLTRELVLLAIAGVAWFRMAKDPA